MAPKKTRPAVVSTIFNIAPARQNYSHVAQDLLQAVVGRHGIVKEHTVSTSLPGLRRALSISWLPSDQGG